MKLEHTYKDVEFLIVIEEEMDDHYIHKCHTVFRTPKGYFAHLKGSIAFLKDFNEDMIKKVACESAYDWYEAAHGWRNEG